MSFSAQFLNPSAAAQRLGVSAKALRLYEQRGLALQLRFPKVSESMCNHDSKIVDAGGVD